jgi:hypothetical protein
LELAAFLCPQSGEALFFGRRWVGGFVPPVPSFRYANLLSSALFASTGGNLSTQETTTMLDLLSQELKNVESVTLARPEIHTMGHTLKHINQAAVGISTLQEVVEFMEVCRNSMGIEELTREFAGNDRIIAGIASAMGALGHLVNSHVDMLANQLNDGIDRAASAPVGPIAEATT